MKHRFKYYCKDYENIENYQKAKADDFKNWEVHHRLETHNSDGERRQVDITADELKALDMYYNRPADELIFMTIYEHGRLHMKGKHFSEETRNKISEAKKGKRISEETKKKIGETHKGKKLSKETRNKMGEAHKGKNIWIKGTRWYNNGKISIRAKECPDGFIPGRIKKP